MSHSTKRVPRRIREIHRTQVSIFILEIPFESHVISSPVNYVYIFFYFSLNKVDYRLKRKDPPENIEDMQPISCLNMKEESEQLFGWKVTYGTLNDFIWDVNGAINYPFIPMTRALEPATGQWPNIVCFR